MLATCAVPGCTTLTIGRLCVEHEPRRLVQAFPRGRPHPPRRVRVRATRLTVPAGKELVPDVVLMEGAS
jgi:hypothetical protein